MPALRVHGERIPLVVVAGRVPFQEASCFCACHEGEGSYEKNGMKEDKVRMLWMLRLDLWSITKTC